MAKDLIELAIVQTVIPDYRVGLFRYILEKTTGYVGIFAGRRYLAKSISSVSEDFFSVLKQTYFFKRRIYWQFLEKSLWSVDLLIIEGNPRCLSTWLLIVSRRFLGKKSYLWMHAFGRKKDALFLSFFRNLLRELSDGIICYTKSQARQLKHLNKGKIILCAPNALLRTAEFPVINKSKEVGKDILYVGRLVRGKKVEKFVKAAIELYKSGNFGGKVQIVGDGEERELLETIVRRSKYKDRFYFHGHVNDYNKLGQIYGDALFSVSPGYVGLSITQSLAYGVPMLVSKNEPHSPEIEALLDGFNGIMLKCDNFQQLAKGMNEMLKNPKWGDCEIREKIACYCRQEYNVERMGKPFLHILNAFKFEEAILSI